jgi:hypothetical protein
MVLSPFHIRSVSVRESPNYDSLGKKEYTECVSAGQRSFNVLEESATVSFRLMTLREELLPEKYTRSGNFVRASFQGKEVVDLSCCHVATSFTSAPFIFAERRT